MSFLDALGSLFAGSTTPLGGLTELVGEKATVDKIFSGINYLQALSTTSIKDLSSALTAGQFKYFPDAADKQNNNANDTNISTSTDSIFNKFTIFSYQNFQGASKYKPEMHFIGAHNSDTTLKQDSTDALSSPSAEEWYQNAAQKIKDKSPAESTQETARTSTDPSIRKTATLLANPNVANIIDWANTTSAISITGFQPYAMTDFMFCRYYGKIPNNRLVTLRRYPFPIDDQIKIKRDGSYQSPIPIAQAVTWFGGDTKNVLSNIGVLNWSMKWKPISSIGSVGSDGTQAQEIIGNEVLVNDLLALGDTIPGLKAAMGALQDITVSLLGSDQQYQQAVGTDRKLQDYAKKLYAPNGPYWNRIYGPVNVIHETTRRERGMQEGWDKAFFLNFHYQFRSFNGLSPKIVALDLISNFLNLTYNDAQFLGQLARFFPKVGLKFDESINGLLSGLLFKASVSLDVEFADNMIEFVAAVKSALATASAEAAGRSIAESIARPIQLKTMKKISNAVPAMIPIRSALSDRPVGEWHLVVGNPLNPIMVMGDLVCKSCSMVFDEEFGPDDFPTGVTFTVYLAQGKPRDKISIERMFNLGESQLAGSILRAPSSENDTFGAPNTALFEALSTLKDKNAQIKGTARNKEIQEKIKEQPAFAKYQNRIRKSYRYTANEVSGNKAGIDAGMVNDSLLYMYFDKSLDRQ